MRKHIRANIHKASVLCSISPPVSNEGRIQLGGKAIGYFTPIMDPSYQDYVNNTPHPHTQMGVCASAIWGRKPYPAVMKMRAIAIRAWEPELQSVFIKPLTNTNICSKILA